MLRANHCKIITAIIFLLFSFVSVAQQQIAFPGAEGGGRFASGGRGGSVYEVVNLNDAGVGSLRDAISEGNRTIIFKVSGEIKLKSRLSIKKDNITIAGQTAPGEGICLTGYTLNISASNIIIRYIRSRFGDDNAVDDDAMNCWNGAYQNIIIDHCSMSWSIDETATFYGIKNFTLQWSLVAESLFRSKHDKGDHGYGGIWGGANATFHHNLVAHHTSRNPRFGGARPGYIPYPANEELVDYRNNVVYNWGNINSTYGGEGGKINMVNNYYKPGPATPGNLTTTSATNKRNRILNYTGYTFDITNSPDTTFGGKFFIDGNYVDGYPEATSDNWKFAVQKDSYVNSAALMVSNRQSTPFAMVSPIQPQTAIQAYNAVLDSVGATLPRRDLIDARIVKETRTGTATYEGAAYAAVKEAGVTHPSGIIDTPANVGGLQKYGSNTAYVDTDKDGMPDAWEKLKGLNSADIKDGSLIASNGYSNLENYLNSINADTGSGPIVNGSGSGTPTINLNGYDAVVALDGTGSHKTIQAAIDAMPINATKAYRIFVKNGKYVEKVAVAANKTFLHLIGESAAKTIISWNDYSGKIVSGVTITTSTSVTLGIRANDVFLQNLTIENTTGDAPQAVALSFDGDRDVAQNCILLGGQDTFLANSDGKRQYIKNCYIDGVVDFIFGSSTAVFDSCVVYAKDRVDKLAGSYITAANTPKNQTYGYIFRNCILPSNNGVTSYVLGRPWQNDASTADASKKYNKVAFINSIFGNKIVTPVGWSIWDSGTNTSYITYVEYKNKQYDGKPVNVASRVAWSKQLSDNEVSPYLSNATIFGNWNPCATTTDLCKTPQSEIALVNIKVEKGANLSIPTKFSWNIAWALKDLKYELYRSLDKKTFEKLKEIVATTDTLINYSFSDDAPPANKKYYYLLRASKSGYQTFDSDTLTVSSIPVITVNGAPKNFLQGLGIPSSSQIYTLAAVNLAEDLSIKVPANFEISLDGGKTWKTSQNTVLVPHTAGTINPINVNARLNSNAIGSFTGTIVHETLGATAQNVAINGTTQLSALVSTQSLAYWSMAVSNADSLLLRAKGVQVSLPSFKRLTLSNGSAIPAYSTLHGQSFAPSSDGGGLWTAAGGGNANNLHRGIYEQFVLKPQTGYSVKVDSLILKSSLFSAATGKLAVVFSKTGFKSDSTDVAGGIAGDGSPLLNTANGAFVTPIIPVSESTGTTAQFKLAITAGTGLTLSPGDSITVRLYFSTGSSSPLRYAKLKDINFRGTVKDLNAKPPVVNITQNISDFSVPIGQLSPVQTYTLKADNLISDLSIIAPIGFEISKDGATWNSSTSPLTITPSAGSIVSTTISIRAITSNTVGTVTGNIIHATAGFDAASLNIKANFVLPLLSEDPKSLIELSPNPTMDEVVVKHPNRIATLTIITTAGVPLKTYHVKNGVESTILDLKNLPTGLYFVEYTNAQERKVVKIIKE